MQNLNKQGDSRLKSTASFDSEKFIMVFGDDNTVFKKFYDALPEDAVFLNTHNGKVKLGYLGFAEEWSEWVDFERSYAYVENGKLHVVVYGFPDYVNKKNVEAYFGDVLEQYIQEEYGEFFETEPGCPILMVVERNGKEVMV